eukprot:MONOS_14524.1-p1 / transcript=MONOS_14524.1 / gene=MONOS_14524 / organism=Monocercomonoides_exilis_PA203 / gene_product=unspecified product / transcript_product=unspecified product / location=Mono_scaffold01018:2855-3904(-) / protein_length=327 / sequence_SO=supercontig / SO=protein_coding / is_pseudo=false
MIAEENLKKKEEKNEKLLIDLCECYISLYYLLSPEIISICVPCLLKVALKKEENEKTQKEAETALLALSNIKFDFLNQGQYLNEIKEIIKHHQEHRNLTRLAYQSAWEFLVTKFLDDGSLKEVIVNELRFGREAARELEALSKCVDWKRKKEVRGKEKKEEIALLRWLQALVVFLSSSKLWNEEFIELIGSIVQVFRAARENKREISYWCISSLRNAAGNGFVPIEAFLKNGAINAVLEEFQRPTLDDEKAYECLKFFINASNRMEEKMDNKMVEVKRKITKKELFDKLEEEGYEDTIISFHKIFDYLNRKYYRETSLNISDYFANI